MTMDRLGLIRSTSPRRFKEDWMVFLGTGPGAGIQLQDGNLVFPVYSANTNVGASQSSAVIISEDHGETWKLGDSRRPFADMTARR